MKRRILLVGSARTELALHTDAFAADGETRFGAFTGNTVPGGPLSYAGVAVTRLGGEAILCSAVGDDQYGRDLVKFYEDLGMDTRFVKTVRGGTSPLGVTAERADGERRSYRSSVLSEAIDGDLVEEAFTSLPDAVWLSLEIPVSAAARVTALAREKKIPVFADGAHIHFVIHFRPLFRRDAALRGIQTVEVLCKKRRQIAIVVKMVLSNVYSAQNQDAIFGEY